MSGFSVLLRAFERKSNSGRGVRSLTNAPVARPREGSRDLALFAFGACACLRYTFNLPSAGLRIIFRIIGLGGGRSIIGGGGGEVDTDPKTMFASDDRCRRAVLFCLVSSSRRGDKVSSTGFTEEIIWRVEDADSAVRRSVDQPRWARESYSYALNGLCTRSSLGWPVG